ncbi:hypothetical protein HY990_05770 [Candidatus Micrarchaeota archaeon]|nr:hypothetical protein [Candidatus Micrarchaeota archaeon]
MCIFAIAAGSINLKAIKIAPNEAPPNVVSLASLFQLILHLQSFKVKLGEKPETQKEVRQGFAAEMNPLKV